jgi:hypothetical protein
MLHEIHASFMYCVCYHSGSSYVVDLWPIYKSIKIRGAVTLSPYSFQPSPCSLGLSATSQQFSQNKSATSNQSTVFFSQNKPAPVVSHQPNEQAL